MEIKILTGRNARSLTELRESLGLSLEEVAKRLEMSAPEVVSLELRAHQLGVTLGELDVYIDALGGELKGKATFPDGSGSRIWP